MELSGTIATWCSFLGSYKCDITNAAITEPGTEIKSIKCAHQAGKSNKDITWIDFSNQSVLYFPRGLSVILPNLTSIYVNGCRLKQISREDLVGFNALETLNLSNNLIVSLPDDLFVGMKKLLSINFSRNKISCASSKLLKPIENKLRTADFIGNVRINGKFDEMTPSTLNDLKRHLDSCDKPKCPSVEVDPVPDFLASYGKKLELLWTTGKMSDFTILVDESEFKVHKVVLGMQSSVFETMFDQEMEENLTGKLKIDIFRPEPVEEFLKFLYTAQLPSATNIIEVFKLAAFYDVPNLTDLCESIIIRNTSESNVVQVVELANLHKRVEMKNAAIEVVQTIVNGKNLEDSVFDDSELLGKILEANSFVRLFYKNV